MAKHAVTSWKQKNPITHLNNSVDKVTHAVEQAASHPTNQQQEQLQQLEGREYTK